MEKGQGIISSRTPRGNALADIVNIFNHFDNNYPYSMEVKEDEGLPMMFVIVKDKEA